MTYRVQSNAVWHSLPGVVTAYQPSGAPDVLAAQYNIGAWQRKLGNYTATPGTAPTWDTVNGWKFVRTSTHWLNTGIVPQFGYAVFARFSNHTVALGAFQVLFACSTSWQIQCLLSATVVSPYSMASTYTNKSVDIGVNVSAGVVGVTLNGLWVNGALNAFSGTPGVFTFIGTLQIGRSGGVYGNFNLQAFAVYARTPSEAEAQLITQQMAYCEVHPAWNAWARQRRWYFVGPLGQPLIRRLGGVPGVAVNRGVW